MDKLRERKQISWTMLQGVADHMTECTNTEKAIGKLRIGDRMDSLTLVTTILHKHSIC